MFVYHYGNMQVSVGLLRCQDTRHQTLRHEVEFN